jgi:epoxyqueuosine reductase
MTAHEALRFGDSGSGNPIELSQVRAETIKNIARECGFELAGVASADPPADFARYTAWVAEGMAGEMRYLTDRRAEVRRDVRNLLPSARSVICVGKLYHQPGPSPSPGHAVISRYAWGPDYHNVMRRCLERMVEKLRAHSPFEYKICVDTAPLLERTFARLAGLGWIGKNTCLINEPLGSWFFLGELITSLELEPDAPPPDRCGTCTRCIDSCPTDAFVPSRDGAWAIDSRRCIAYFTIELRGTIPHEHRAAMGPHIFGCDICQDVCPWNSRAPVTDAFSDLHSAPGLDACARLSEAEFNETFRNTALARPKHAGFLRNVAIAMGNSGAARFHAPLEHLARHSDPVVAEHAQWALQKLQLQNSTVPEPAVVQ